MICPKYEPLCDFQYLLTLYIHPYTSILKALYPFNHLAFNQSSHNMPLSLRPYPGIYAELAAEWEVKEVRRQQVSEPAMRTYIISQRNHFLILFVLFIVAILILQTSLFLHKVYMSRRRAARRQLYADDAASSDVEDVVAISWVDDEKALAKSDGLENE